MRYKTKHIPYNMSNIQLQIELPTEKVVRTFEQKFLERYVLSRLSKFSTSSSESKDEEQPHEWSTMFCNYDEPRCKYFHEESSDLFFCYDCKEYMCADCFCTEASDHIEHHGWISEYYGDE